MTAEQLETAQAQFIEQNPNPACIFEEFSNDLRDQASVRWLRWSDVDRALEDEINSDEVR